nr:GNAT family N-acetyltransferase [Lysinibacillus timonensis]
MLEYKVVKTGEQLQKYKQHWSDLLAEDNNDNPFIEYEWFSLWWETLGKNDPVEVYVVLHNKQPISFFPFIHKVKFGVHHFSFAGEGDTIYSDIITNEFWREEAIQYIMKVFSKRFGKVIFSINHLLESKETSKVIEKYVIQQQLAYSFYRIVVPLIDLSKSDEPLFKRRMNKKFKDLNRCERRLKSLGKLTVTELKENNMLEKVFALYSKRWEKRLEGSGFATEKRDFFQRISQVQSEVFNVEVNGLQFENQLIGFTYDFCCRGRKVGYKMGHDPDFKLLGPGRLIEREGLLKSQNLQYKLYDLGWGYEPYKLDWATDLDFTRKYIISTKGFTERLLRNVYALLYSIRYRISTNQKYVVLKRDWLGKVRYLLKNFKVKTFLQHSFRMLKKLIYWNITDYYYLEQQVTSKSLNYKKVRIQDILELPNREYLIPYYVKGYKLSGDQENNIIYIRHNHLMRLKHIELIEELKPNSTFLKWFRENELEKIVADIQHEGRAIWTSVNIFSKQKKQELEKVGFKRVRRIHFFRLLNFKKSSSRLIDETEHLKGNLINT